MSEQNHGLLDFVSSLSAGDGMRVEETLGGGYVRLRVSEAERRQAKHDIRCVEDAVVEMLRNARDAGATHIFLAISREGDLRTLWMVDDGMGIPSSMHDRVFDARVTSKLDTMHFDRWGVHGRGMALYSIRENALSANVVDSFPGGGTAMRVVFDVTRIPERADQSTWPTLARGSEPRGVEALRGPHNIYRACAEFALEVGDACNVYCGSVAEVISAMRYRMGAGASYALDDMGVVPVASRCCLCANARELCDVAGSLGMEMSERNAHRIIRKEIRPLRNVRSRLLGADGSPSSRRALSGTARRLFLDERDVCELRERFARACSVLEERYYVRIDGDPVIRVSEGRLSVQISFAEDD